MVLYLGLLEDHAGGMSPSSYDPTCGKLRKDIVNDRRARILQYSLVLTDLRQKMLWVAESAPLTSLWLGTFLG